MQKGHGGQRNEIGNLKMWRCGAQMVPHSMWCLSLVSFCPLPTLHRLAAWHLTCGWSNTQSAKVISRLEMSQEEGSDVASSGCSKLQWCATCVTRLRTFYNFIISLHFISVPILYFNMFHRYKKIYDIWIKGLYCRFQRSFRPDVPWIHRRAPSEGSLWPSSSAPEAPVFCGDLMVQPW